MEEREERLLVFLLLLLYSFSPLRRVEAFLVGAGRTMASSYTTNVAMPGQREREERRRRKTPHPILSTARRSLLHPMGDLPLLADPRAGPPPLCLVPPGRRRPLLWPSARPGEQSRGEAPEDGTSADLDTFSAANTALPSHSLIFFNDGH